MREYLIRCNHISKTIASRTLFEDTSFDILKNDCIGIVGPNGCGKTTLLKTLLERIPVEDGEIWRAPNLNIRLLPQVSLPEDSETVDSFLARITQPESIQSELLNVETQLSDPSLYESSECEQVMERLNELQLSIGKAVMSSQVAKAYEILTELGMGKIEKTHLMKDLSGGERQKVVLAGVFADPLNCDLLLMDEPTNHLDIETIEWLEEEIAGFPGSLVIVTHDRYLLDDLANHIMEFEGTNVMTYHADYDGYVQQREMRHRIKKTQFLKAKAEEKRYLDSIEKMSRRNKYDAKIKQKKRHLQNLEMPTDPVLDEYLMRFHIENVFKSGKNIADGQDILKRFDDKLLLEEGEFEIFSDQKVGLIGPNGCGKTTLLKMIIGKIPPDEGKIHMSAGVQWRYFDQGHLSLEVENTLVDEVLRDHPGLDENDAKALLGQFDFTGKKIWSKVETLSGGERARLAFLRLVMEPANFLILDEPTNHMDIQSKNSIERALALYKGSVLVVSHDRQFLDRVCDNILWMSNEELLSYKGNYSAARAQRLSGLSPHSKSDRVTGMNVKRYVALKKFTEWKSNQKYSPGDEVFIGDHNRELFEWALETGRLAEKKRKKRR